VPVDGFWGLAQHLLAVEGRPQFVVPESIGQAQRMGGLDVWHYIQGLDPGGVLQDHSKLGLVRLELFVSEAETRQPRNMGNIDLYRHRGGV